MAHELSIRSNGLAEMAYVGDTPWHGLGQALPAGQSIEQWQTAAGMDWRVLRAQVRYNTSRDGDQLILDDKHVLFRSDSKAPLGVVSDNFKVVQPAQVLEFFRDLVDQGGMQLETAGTLFGGKRFWALAKTGDTGEVVAGDKVNGYLLLCTGADGSLATSAKFTSVRVVCNNTLSMARNTSAAANAAGASEVRLTHRSVFDPQAFKASMGLAHKSFDVFMTNMRALAEKTLDSRKVSELTVALLSKSAGNLNEEALTKIVDSKPFQTIQALYQGTGRGSRMHGVEGTAWGWVNSVTEFVDHVGVSRNDDNRLNSAWFGPGEAMKSAAVELALAV